MSDLTDLQAFGSLRWWLDIGQESEAHGAVFTGVSDYSGNSRDFVQEAGVEIVADGRYGAKARAGSGSQLIKAADFRSGGDRLYRNEAGLLQAACTVFFVLYPENQAVPPASQFLFDTGTDGADSRHYGQWTTSGALLFGNDGGSPGTITSAAPALTVKRTSIVVMTYNGASSRLLVDYQTPVTGTITNSNSAAPMRIGSRMDASSPGYLSIVQVFEAGAYSGALTAAQQDGLRDYLAQKYQRTRWAAPSGLVMS